MEMGFFLLRVEVVRKGFEGRTEKGEDVLAKGAEDPFPPPNLGLGSFGYKDKTDVNQCSVIEEF